MQQEMFVRTALAERTGPLAAVREFQMNFGLIAVERNGDLNLGSFGNGHGTPIGCFFGDICHKNDKAEKKRPRQNDTYRFQEKQAGITYVL